MKENYAWSEYHRILWGAGYDEKYIDTSFQVKTYSQSEIINFLMEVPGYTRHQAKEIIGGYTERQKLGDYKGTKK